MDICLISSLNTYEDWYTRERGPTYRILPLGILSLAAVLDEAGHQISIVDPNFLLNNSEIKIDQYIYTNIAKHIVNMDPQVIGFSTMCNSYHITLRVAEIVKSYLPHIPIVLGGPQASVVDRETLAAFPFIDFILRGEAEYTLPKLIDNLALGHSLDNLPNLTFKVNGRIIRNPKAQLISDMDELPIPAYNLFPYNIGSAPTIDVGRGCPYHCSFCSTATFWQRQNRMKTISRIIKEMKLLIRDYNATSISFMHDLFTLNKHFIREFCQRIKSENIEVFWSCNARPDSIDHQLLSTMAEVGCEDIFYEVETGSIKLQKHIRKRLKLGEVIEVIDATLDLGINPTVSFITGFPTETEDDLSCTLDMIHELILRERVTVQLHLLAPQNGTSDYDKYSGLLKYDGFYSDIAGINPTLNDTEWFKDYPDIFSSFYYFETDTLPRELIRSIDIFVNSICANMPKTITQLLNSEDDLLGLYKYWLKWSATHERSCIDKHSGTVDELMMDFYSFISEIGDNSNVGIDYGITRDEIITYYLWQHNDVPVEYIEEPPL